MYLLHWCSVLMLLFGQVYAQALDPNKKITQFISRNWQIREGLPQNSITCMAQTSDGYMWFGTYEGVVRFNGKTFTVFDTRTIPQLKSNRISALCEDNKKNLFIATMGGGIVRYSAGKFESVMLSAGQFRHYIIGGQLYKDKNGILWALTDGLVILRYEKDGFVEFSYPFDFGDRKNCHLAVGGNGNIYLSTSKGFYEIDYPNVQDYSYKNIFPGQTVYGMAKDPNGGVLFILKNALMKFPGLQKHAFNYPFSFVNRFYCEKNGAIWSFNPGLVRYVNGGTEFSKLTGSATGIVTSCMNDREGNFWIGTDGKGLIELSEAKFTTYSKDEGLKGSVVWSVCEDKSGNLWTSSLQSIIGKIKNGKVENIPLYSPADRGGFISIYPLHNGNIAATSKQLYEYVNGRFINISGHVKGLRDLHTIYEDSKGAIWVGSAYDGLHRFAKGQYTHFGLKEGIAHPYVSAIAEDKNGHIWVGSRGGLQEIADSKIVRSYRRSTGLTDDWVRVIYVDDDNVIWVGTDNGLNKLENGKLFNYTTKHGLYNNVFHTILEDNRGTLWFSCNKGIYCIPKEQFFLYDKRKIPSLKFKLFNVDDGLKSGEGNGSTQPAGWKTRNGRLMFATADGVAIINPDGILKNNLPPPVVIEEIVVDDSSFNVNTNRQLSLSPGSHDLHFHFAALSYANPDRNVYKAFLKGYDSKPQLIDEKMEINYTNVPPGKYTFVVTAGNNDEVWNYSGASLQIEIPERFYTSLWFRIALILLLFTVIRIIIHIIYQRRLKKSLQLVEYQMQLEKERARISRDIHDEVGASLTKIAILTELAKRHATENPAVEEPLHKITELSRDAIANFSEIIWAVNPKNDKIPNAVAYIREYIQKTLNDTPVQCSIIYPDEIPNAVLSAEIRRNIFLVIKEAIHNVAKHSGAKKVKVLLEVDMQRLKYEIEDDGIGFDIDTKSEKGNGLANMKSRISEIGGEFNIVSSNGTRISFIVPLHIEIKN